MRPIQLTATIVSAYVSNNTVPSMEIPGLISEVYSALMRVTNGRRAGRAAQAGRSHQAFGYARIHCCLEDGKKFKSLKRHLLGTVIVLKPLRQSKAVSSPDLKPGGMCPVRQLRRAEPLEPSTLETRRWRQLRAAVFSSKCGGRCSDCQSP